MQSSLAKLLPEDDQTPDMFEQALRCPQLAEAIGEMEESLETVTPEVLQKRENESWSARVGDRCEGRYMAVEYVHDAGRVVGFGRAAREVEHGLRVVDEEDDLAIAKLLRPRRQDADRHDGLERADLLFPREKASHDVRRHRRRRDVNRAARARTAWLQ